ncbi:unnamed protein product [Durusdinium trenchii]|uniref:Uncharacterized protein n=1 Tax=Durusdinium trenchii TaxID=1381693 RepID=A0ABP0SJN0_9DINO
MLDDLARILAEAVDHAESFPLNPLLSLEHPEDAQKSTVQELWNGSAVRDEIPWATTYKWRCQQTFQTRKLDLVWLEDKQEQRELMSCWPLKAQPLSSRWFTAELQFPEALAELGSWLDHGRAAVVKPRHAACGQGLTVLQPGATEPERLQALEDAFKVECKKGETWQLYQVAKGVGVEEVYPSVGASLKEPDRPLELKLQTSQDVWITADGHVLRCDARKGGIRRKYGPLPEWILDGGLESLLKEHWEFLVTETEAIARCWGLDEVRVDWFLGILGSETGWEQLI